MKGRSWKSTGKGVVSRRPLLALLLSVSVSVGVGIGVTVTFAVGASELSASMAPGIVEESSLELGTDGVRRWRGEPFTGTAATWYSSPASGAAGLRELVEYTEGRREGLRLRWFEGGQLSNRLRYRQGRLHGLAESFWDSGAPRTRASYVDGHGHGESKHWYREGMIFKQLQLVDGREQGLQRAWRRNGKLYANYEAVNGRNFGLHTTDLCYEVSLP